MTEPVRRRPFLVRHPVFTFVVVVLAAVFATVLVLVAVDADDADRAQRRLDPFYTPPATLPEGPLGTIIRSEPLDIGPAGSRGWRVLYVTEDAYGNRLAASGMVFAPTATPPAGGYPVVAWAHGTVGMGDSCAPSRSKNPIGQMTWLGGMINNGWVVTATDYAGLGTPGTLNYLVGVDAAHDVLNSVRAARSLVDTTSPRFAVYGHSQGGASSLWTAELARTYAPDLQLVAAAAAAPAAELRPLLNQQWDTGVGWAIGAEVLEAWPNAYPELNAKQLTTRVGQRNYARIANECVLEGGLEAQARTAIGQQIFRTNPSADPLWGARIDQNTPRPLPRDIPVMVIQGLADTIVLPNTTTLLVERWCAAGSTLTAAWLGDQGHITLGKVGGPLATTWLQQRFDGVPAPTTCGTSLPVPPAPSAS
jgi:pimeloyl-ACP methyl ester carboxylesterase